MMKGKIELPGPFKYTNSGHLELVKLQTEAFSKSLAELQAIDRNIIVGASIGTVSYFGCYLFPLVTVAIAGYAFATWNLAHRTQAFENYKNAMDDLIRVYKWSMGEDTGNHWNKLAVKDLQDLILTLGPWVPSDVIHTWREEDLKPGMLAFTTKREELKDIEPRLRELARGVQATQLAFRFYGQNGIDDICSLLKEKVCTQASQLFAASFNKNN